MSKVALVHNIPVSYQHALFCEMARQGLDFEVLFMARGSNQRLEAPDLDRGNYSYRIGYDGPYEAVHQVSSAFFVIRSLERLRPDAVIIGGWSDAASWAAWTWSLLRRRPKILWMESTEADHRRTSWKENIKRVFATHCNLAHVYGAKSAEYLAKLGLPADRIVAGRAVIDDKRFTASPKEPRNSRELVVLYVGRFSPEKNLDRLLYAFHMCSSELGPARIRLMLVGYGPQEPELRSLVQDLGLRNVEFPGPATQAELPGRYASADVLILPSLSEPWGLVVNEAMLCGLPALVSDRCGCAPDLVTPETGWLFSPMDCEQIANVIQTAAKLPKERLRSMGNAARERALSYTPARCASAVIDTIRRVTQPVKRPVEVSGYAASGYR